MLYTNIYDVNEWSAEVIEMKAQGFSTRHIARSLFDKESYRNRLNKYFKREDVIDEIYHQACQIELNKQIESKVTEAVNENMSSKLKSASLAWEVKEKPLVAKAKSPVKTLYFDIETTLAKSYHWGQWQQNLSVKQQIQESHMLSHAWAWGDGEVFSSVLTPEEVLNQDDERIVYEIWSLLDNCDIVVAHNGKRFDVKKVNGYFLKYGLPKPSSYKVIDTLEIAKKHFNLPFKSLEYLAKFLNVELKQDSGGIQTWIDCDRGDPEALATMEFYNRGDVVTLREIHNKLRGWDNNGVNIALYNDNHDTLCTHCGGDDISVITDKFAYTPNRKYQVYRCNSCKAVLRGNKKEGVGNKLVKVV